MFHTFTMFPRWRAAVLFLLFSLLMLAGLCGYAQQATSPYSFVPIDSPVTVFVDVPLLWQSTADFRTNPMIGGGLQNLEKELGISIANDVLPWAGLAAFTVTDSRPDNPGGAILLQIRDTEHMMSSARVEALLQKILQSGEQTKWLALEYKGIPIRRFEMPQGRSVLKVATATVDGWLVIAIGDGAIRAVIDARDGSIPALMQHPLFGRATGGLPAEAIGQVCVNGQGILAQAQKSGPAAPQVNDAELGKSFLAGAVTYTNDNLQLDTTYCTSSVKTQAMLKQLNADVGAISGASLAQQPEGAFATLLIANPDKWLGDIEQFIMNSVGGAEEGDATGMEMAGINGLRPVLKQFTGELGVSGAWRDGKGFGVTLAGQAGANDGAVAAAKTLDKFLQEMMQMPVEVKDNLYTIPAIQGGGMFTMLPCWTARDQWLLGASHPDWLAPRAAQPALALPEYAQGANLAAFGNFSFMQPMMKTMGADEGTLAMISAMKLFTGQWGLAVKIEEDGGAVRCHLAGGLPVMAMSAAVLFPVFAKAREKARIAQSMSNLRQLAVAALIYAQDHDRLPVMNTAADIKAQLGGDLGGGDRLLISPRTNEPYEPNPTVSGKSPDAFDAATMIVFYEKTAGADGSHCAAFLDGHVQVIQAAEWNAAKQQAKIP